jgi:hypothetical protein
VDDGFGWISFSKTVEFHNCIIMVDYEPVYFDFGTEKIITEEVLWRIENNSYLFKIKLTDLKRV